MFAAESEAAGMRCSASKSDALVLSRGKSEVPTPQQGVGWWSGGVVSVSLVHSLVHERAENEAGGGQTDLGKRLQ